MTNERLAEIETQYVHLVGAFSQNPLHGILRELIDTIREKDKEIEKLNKDIELLRASRFF